MKTWQVLVVDDDTDGREVVGLILRFHHITCVGVPDADEALDKLDGVDGVIIDLNLPGMDGWSLLKRIRREPRWATLPCVAITAYYSKEVANKALDAGFAAFFPKPVEPAAFARELKRVLRSSNPENTG
ncbi:MAG: response regulator [Anaerolineae bacterium]